MKKLLENVPDLPEKKEDIEAWYQKMMTQYEEDSKTEDFSIPDEWDFDFRAAMGIVELDEYLARAEQIQTGKQSAESKAVQLAAIMTKMERQYEIPMLRDPKWEAKNQEIITAYRKISDMREF